MNIKPDIDGIEIVKTNIKLEKSIKEWYRYKARTMAMDMSQLMAYVLTNYCETQKNSEALRTMSNITANTDTKTLQAENVKMIAEFMKGIDKMKEMADNGQLSLVAESIKKAQEENQEN